MRFDQTEIESLVILAKNGDQMAKNILVRKLSGFIPVMIKKYKANFDEDDVQDCMMALLNSIKSYKPGMNTRFTTWLTLNIRSVMQYKRLWGHQKYDNLRSDIDEEIEDNSSNSVEVLKISHRLAPELRYLVRAISAGYNSEDIAEALGISRKTVSLLIRRIRIIVKKKDIDYLC